MIWSERYHQSTYFGLAIPHYPYDESKIKTGDIHLTRDGDGNLAKKIRWGSYITHVGIFHRCPPRTIKGI